MRSPLAALALLAAAVPLGGCAARLIPPGVAGDTHSVSISNTWGAAEALPLAREHCAIYGKIPRQREWKPVMTMVFDCVPPAAAPGAR